MDGVAAAAVVVVVVDDEEEEEEEEEWMNGVRIEGRSRSSVISGSNASISPSVRRVKLPKVVFSLVNAAIYVCSGADIFGK